MKLPKKIIIVGLGNPGDEFVDTPHNAGFMVIDELTEQMANGKWQIVKKDYNFAEVHEIKLNKTKIILAKPLTFMNNSGVALKKVLRTYNLQATHPHRQRSVAGAATYNLIVVHDDADLPLGSIRMSFGSSSGGHKGVEDVIKKLKTKNFYRFRIGIADAKRPKKRTQKTMNAFVTKKLTGAKKQKLEKSTKLCAEIIAEILETGEINLERKNYKIN